MPARNEAMAVFQVRADGGLSLHNVYGDREEIYLVASSIETCSLIECTGGGENEEMLSVN